MKLVYASRMGHVKQFVESVAHDNVLRIEKGDEVVDEEFILVTYTDGRGIVPPMVDAFLKKNGHLIRGVAASGSMARHADTFCYAADIIKKQYICPIIAEFDMEGDRYAVDAVRASL